MGLAGATVCFKTSRNGTDRGNLPDDQLHLLHLAGGVPPVLLADEEPGGMRLLPVGEGDDDVDGVRVVGLPDVGRRRVGGRGDVRVEACLRRGW